MIDNTQLQANNSTEPDNNPLHEAVQFYWGERCAEHEDGCPTCVAWKFYDNLTSTTKLYHRITQGETK